MRYALIATTVLITVLALLGDSTPMSLDLIPSLTTPQIIQIAMPSFTFSSIMPANGVVRPLDGWQYEYLPWPAEVLVMARSTDVNIVAVYTSGSETIVEESPVQAGGTIGVIPSSLNTPIQGWRAAAGDRLKLSYRETAGGTPNIEGIIEINPL